MSSFKRVVVKSRNRLLSNVTVHVDKWGHELLKELKVLGSEIDKRKAELERLGLEINHNQVYLLGEIEKKVKNSGTFQLSESEIITKIFSGLKMYLDPRDIAVVPHLVLDSIWEHRITTAWLAVVKPQDTVIDIGANFGYFGALAAQRTDKKNSKIVFFEANPRLIPYINKTLSVNWLNEQSVVENLAIAEKDGRVVLNVLKDYIGSSSLHSAKELDKYMHNKMHVETSEEIPVQATTIDNYCKRNDIGPVNLIKMDIEGYEDKAYAGMRKTVQSSPDLTLFVEFTKDGYKDPRGFYEQMLEDFGNVYVLNDEGYILKPKKTDYESIIGDADDWVMPIFSKKPNLAKK